MVQSISAASIIRCGPICGGFPSKGVSLERKSHEMCLEPPPEFVGRRLVIASRPPVLRLRATVSSVSPVKALAMELTKEAYSSKEEDRIPWGWNYHVGTDVKPRLWPPPNRADKPSLHNPLLRQERMGCGWLGAILEWEGVIVEHHPEIEKRAWLALSQEEGKSPPPAFILRRIEGMKNEQAISEVLCWSRDPMEMRRLASRKEEVYRALQGGIYRLRDGSRKFVNVLTRHKIPMALVSTSSRKSLETAIGATGVGGYFTAIVSAEDVHRGRPDPGMYIYAAQLLKFMPERCIVFGNSNQTVEAAHDVRMKCVAVASKHPIYELGAADLVVRQLDELSIVDLKNLADIEYAEFETGEPDVEVEMEEDEDLGRRSSAAVDDEYW